MSVAVDSLMWSLPDSALVLLQEHLDPKSHYAQLLLSELLYKNDHAQTNRTGLMAAVAHYDSLVAADARGASRRQRNAFLDARAHYINGVGYYESDSVVEACVEYLKALEVMGGRFKESELTGHKAKFMELAHIRLTVLFSDQYLHEQAIFFAKQALGYHENSGSPPWNKSWLMDEIGSHFDMAGQLDSADYYYNSAIECINDTNSLMYRDVRSHQAYLSYQREGMTDSIMDVLYGLLYKAENEREYYARCLTIGEIYHYAHSLDSAWKYLNDVYENTNRCNAKKQAAEWLIDISIALGREDEKREFASYLAPYATHEENYGILKSRLSELYKNHVRNWSERQHSEKNRRVLIQVAIVFGGLLLVLSAVLCLYLGAKSNARKLDRKLKEERVANEMKRKALEGRYKNKGKSLNPLINIMEQRTQDEVSKRCNAEKGTGNYESLLQAPICKEVIGLVEQLHQDPRIVLKTTMDVVYYKRYALSSSQLISLSNTVEDLYPYLYSTLKARYPSLSKKEWNYCLMHLLQLKSLEVCVLLQDPYYTCRRYTQKLERIFQCKQGLSLYLISQL